MNRRPLVLRAIVGFGRFWWDFLIGDTPELFVAVVVILGIVALTSVSGHANTLSEILEPLLVVLALVVSLARTVRSRG